MRRRPVFLLWAVLVVLLTAGIPMDAAAAPSPVTVSPVRVSAVLAWPHPVGQKMTRTITYAIQSPRAITLRLSVSATLAGKSAVAHPFTMNRTSLTVPARARRSVTLTIQGSGPATGTYNGRLTARSGDGRVTVRTALAAVLRPKPQPPTPIGPGGPRLTVRALDRAGKPAQAKLEMDRLDAPEPAGFPYWSRTGQPMLIPAGEYNVRAEILSPDGSLTLANAVIHHRGNSTSTLDSRKAQHVRVAVERKDAAPVDTRIHMTFDNGPDRGTPIGPRTPVFVLPVSSPRLHYSFTSVWARYGKVTDSPYLYALADHRHGSTPTKLDYRPRDTQLAKVVTTYRAPGRTASPADLNVLQAGHPIVHATIQRPATITWYRTPGLPWSTHLTDDQTSNTGTRTWDTGTSTETWGGATLGPSLFDPNSTGQGHPAATRKGNTLTFTARQLYADSDPGHSNSALGGLSTTSALEADGRTLAAAGARLQTGLWPDPKTYTLKVSDSRSARISTKIDLAWTFHSQHTDTSQPLPLIVIRYTPQLDGQNTAKAGSQTHIPLRIERNPRAPETEVNDIKIEASTDGTTWQPLQTTRTTNGWTTTMTNPTSPGFVSLRATATDTNGNQVTQTIHHAYEVAQ